MTLKRWHAADKASTTTTRSSACAPVIAGAVATLQVFVSASMSVIHGVSEMFAGQLARQLGLGKQFELAVIRPSANRNPGFRTGNPYPSHERTLEPFTH